MATADVIQQTPPTHSALSGFAAAKRPSTLEFILQKLRDSVTSSPCDSPNPCSSPLSGSTCGGFSGSQIIRNSSELADVTNRQTPTSHQTYLSAQQQHSLFPRTISGNGSFHLHHSGSGVFVPGRDAGTPPVAPTTWHLGPAHRGLRPPPMPLLIPTGTAVEVVPAGSLHVGGGCNGTVGASLASCGSEVFALGTFGSLGAIGSVHTPTMRTSRFSISTPPELVRKKQPPCPGRPDRRFELPWSRRFHRKNSFNPDMAESPNLSEAFADKTAPFSLAFESNDAPRLSEGSVSVGTTASSPIKPTSQKGSKTQSSTSSSKPFSFSHFFSGGNNSQRNTRRNSVESSQNSPNKQGNGDPETPKSRSKYLRDFVEITEIGRGSFGIVHEAKHKLDGRIYAVKEVFPRENMESRLREVRMLAQCGHHVNIVKYYHSWKENNLLYIQTELCKGGSVTDRYPVGTRWWLQPELCELMRQVANALKHLHNIGIVHLDVKFENVFIQIDRNTGLPCYVLGDFGMARLVTDSFDSEGDTRYLCRHMLNPSRIQSDLSLLMKQADIFALGASVYELARGVSLPINGDEWHHLRDGCLPGIDRFTEPFRQLLYDMMHPKPQQRPDCDQILIRVMLTTVNPACLPTLSLSVNLSTPTTTIPPTPSGTASPNSITFSPEYPETSRKVSLDKQFPLCASPIKGKSMLAPPSSTPVGSVIADTVLTTREIGVNTDACDLFRMKSSTFLAASLPFSSPTPSFFYANPSRRRNHS